LYDTKGELTRNNKRPQARKTMNKRYKKQIQRVRMEFS